jgi:biopolymer transport protein ExbD
MSKRRREPADITANLTSLIDVTFLLIVFFVLVSRVNEVERFKLELPQLRDARTEPPEDEHRVVINVIPALGGEIEGYLVGLAEFASDEQGVKQMTEHLTGLYQVTPGINVNVRADRFTHYEFVEPAMQAVATAARNAGVAGGPLKPRVNLVVATGG